MCLAIPGQLLSISQEQAGVFGEVSFAGLKKRCDLSLVPEAKEGDYLIVHAGFALTVLDEHEAQDTLDAFAAMKALQEEGDHEISG